MVEVNVQDIAQIERARQAAGGLYREFLRQPSMSLGLYVLEAGAEDPQTPHAEDEVYYVISGRATVRVEGRDSPVGPGSVVFVGKRVEHRFHSISERLELLVVFAPAESG
jgi:mannose-6-phosphate isomerase-like protein (cupin superfamily)